jgi:hypothetical protein
MKSIQLYTQLSDSGSTDEIDELESQCFNTIIDDKIADADVESGQILGVCVAELPPPPEGYKLCNSDDPVAELACVEGVGAALRWLPYKADWHAFAYAKQETPELKVGQLWKDTKDMFTYRLIELPGGLYTLIDKQGVMYVDPEEDIEDVFGGYRYRFELIQGEDE